MTGPAIHPEALYDVEKTRRLVAPEGEPFHRDTVYRMAKRGVLPAVRLGPRGGRVAWRGQTIIDYREGRDA